MSEETLIDLLVVGGGINGAGIARDAAGRGLSVMLCERDDLAGHTSSGSTKLVHGGLRYLEHYEFALVRKALQERELLLDAAPHIVRPLRFVMPHAAHLRPTWLIRAGLLLYDHLARRKRLPGSAVVNLRRHPAGAALESHYTRGYVYSDAWVDDARLVVLNAVAARELGATIRTRTRCISAHRDGDTWLAELAHSDGTVQQLRTRALVNATGPWAAQFLREVAQRPSDDELRLVKGSHIVVRRLFAHEFAYIFQAPDRRIVFAIPYEGDYTLVGTTDVEYHGDPARVSISVEERDYLLRMVNLYFERDLASADVLWSYAAVRPLLEDEAADASRVTRDYSLRMDADGPPLLSVFGGKITTFRRLAEEAVDELLSAFGERRPAWTAGATLPGGDIAQGDLAALLRESSARYPFLSAALLQRQVQAYGTRLDQVLQRAATLADLGAELVPGLYACEVQYLRREEWAVTAEDILWRRSKLGLHLPAQAAHFLQHWIEEHP